MGHLNSISLGGKVGRLNDVGKVGKVKTVVGGRVNLNWPLTEWKDKELI